MPFAFRPQSRAALLDDVAGRLTQAWADLQKSSSRTPEEIAKKWADIRAALDALTAP